MIIFTMYDLPLAGSPTMAKTYFSLLVKLPKPSDVLGLIFDTTSSFSASDRVPLDALRSFLLSVAASDTSLDPLFMSAVAVATMVVVLVVVVVVVAATMVVMVAVAVVALWYLRSRRVGVGALELPPPYPPSIASVLDVDGALTPIGAKLSGQSNPLFGCEPTCDGNGWPCQRPRWV